MRMNPTCASPRWRRAHSAVRHLSPACSGPTRKSDNVRVSENPLSAEEGDTNAPRLGSRIRQNAGGPRAGRQSGRRLGDFGYVRLRLHAAPCPRGAAYAMCASPRWRRAHLPVRHLSPACSGPACESDNVRVSANSPLAGEGDTHAPRPRARRVCQHRVLAAPRTHLVTPSALSNIVFAPCLKHHVSAPPARRAPKVSKLPYVTHAEIAAAIQPPTQRSV